MIRSLSRTTLQDTASVSEGAPEGAERLNVLARGDWHIDRTDNGGKVFPVVLII